MAKLSDWGLVALPEYRDIDVTQVPYRNGHRYVVTGIKEKLLGVTTYLGIKDKSGFLVPWARKQASEKFMTRMLAVEDGNKPGEDGYTEYIKSVFEWAKADDKSALEEGTATHNLIQNFYGGTSHVVEEPLLSRVMPSVSAAQTLVHAKGYRTIGVEIPIWHPYYDLRRRDRLAGL